MTYVPYVTCIRDIWFDRVCISVTWLCCSFAPATEGGRSWLGWPDWNSKLPCALPRDSKRRTCFFSTVFEQVQGCQVHDYCFSYFGMCSNLFHAVHLQPISLIFFNIRIINSQSCFLGHLFRSCNEISVFRVANLFQNLFGRRHHRIFEGCSKWIEIIVLHFFKPATFNPSCVKHSAASSLPTCGPPWENRNEGSIDSILSGAMARKSTGSSKKARKLRDGNGIDPVDIIQPLSQLLGFVDKPTRPTSKSRGLQYYFPTARMLGNSLQFCRRWQDFNKIQ